MRVSLRRPPTLLDQLVGRKRAKVLRRRLGLVALGTGVSLLKPRTIWPPLLATATLVVVVVASIDYFPHG